MENNIIPIFFSIDDNYSELLQIALKSIKTNSSRDYIYRIYILNNGLSETHKNNILKYADENYQIDFVDMKEKIKNISNKLFTRDYYSKSTYYRLFIPAMFPELDKALYLDADIIVQGDISELYNFDLGDNLVGAITDEAVSSIGEFIEYVENYLGIKHEDYFNAGILSMNLRELRNIDFENKFLNLINQIKFAVAQDQDYLNVICKGKVQKIPGVWDKMPFPSSIPENELKLIHYNLTLKPWHYDGIPYEDIFYSYAESAGLMDFVKSCKENFNEEKKQIDQLGGDNLKKLAYDLSLIDDTFINLVDNGKITL